MLRLGMILLGGAVITAGAGLALLSVVASGAASQVGVLVSCAPTVPPEDETEEEQKQKSESTS